MDSFVEKKIIQSIQDRKYLHTKFLENCASYKDFLELEKKAFMNGVIDRKYKELMALSISLVTKCEPCIEWHVQQALIAGASEKKIYETIDVAIEMGGGPAAAYARYALRAMEFHNGNNSIKD
jgi:AhpD family alkylhydroperoxidase